jgi:hypothetical protein
MVTLVLEDAHKARLFFVVVVRRTSVAHSFLDFNRFFTLLRDEIVQCLKLQS